MYNKQAMDNLLAAIRRGEAPRGYGQIYGGAKGVSKSIDVSRLSVADVLSVQQAMIKAGSASTACGGYQFLRKTLLATVTEMGIDGGTIWGPELQDRMAVHLMEGRGLSKYLAGNLSRDDFANNLAKEWASLPVVTAIRGAKRNLQPGQSYYAGDGLNKSNHPVSEIVGLVDALNQAMPAPAPEQPQDAPIPPPVPPYQPAPETKPRGLLAALLDLLLKLFGGKKP